MENQDFQKTIPMPAKARGGARPGAGRKKVVPEGARIRQFALSDDEAIEVRRFISSMRHDKAFEPDSQPEMSFLCDEDTPEPELRSLNPRPVRKREAEVPLIRDSILPASPAYGLWKLTLDIMTYAAFMFMKAGGGRRSFPSVEEELKFLAIVAFKDAVTEYENMERSNKKFRERRDI